jgi:hypothetical protein
VEAVDNFDKLIRTTELTSIRVDAALDNALYKQLGLREVVWVDSAPKQR